MRTHIQRILALLVFYVLSVPLASATIILVTHPGDSFSEGCTLVAAIASANNDVSQSDCEAGDGKDLIGFSSSLHGSTIFLDQGATIESEVSINGPGADRLTISAPGRTLFTVGGPSPAKVLIANVTLANSERALLIREGHHLSLAKARVVNNVSTTSTISVEGSLLVAYSTISGNDSRCGGGIANAGGKIVIVESTLVGNTARSGGGILNAGGEVTLINSTISGNQATPNAGPQKGAATCFPLPLGSGGGITNTDNQLLGELLTGEVVLVDSTIANNSGLQGGGIYQTKDVSLNHTRSIIANNLGGDCVSVVGLVFQFEGWVGDGSCASTWSGNPGLAPLADNGGPTLTHALQPNSQAIDLATSCSPFGTDQRGARRPFDGDGDGTKTCDLGAVEFGAEAPIYADDFEDI